MARTRVYQAHAKPTGQGFLGLANASGVPGLTP